MKSGSKQKALKQEMMMVLATVCEKIPTDCWYIYQCRDFLQSYGVANTIIIIFLFWSFLFRFRPLCYFKLIILIVIESNYWNE